MAEQSYPFENQSTSETQYSTLFRLLADTGVAGSTTSADLRPYGDSSGMFVKVPTGTALVRGFLYVNDTPLTLTVAAASSAQRVDSVVLRLDPAGNTITATVKAGTAGGGAPALTQTDTGTYEVRLADVTVPAGATTVTAAQVTDRRPFTSQPWGEWTTDTRPAAPARGKAGYNQTSGRPEFWDGNGWQPFSATTTDASTLSSGTLPNGRLDYGVLAAVRGDRNVDAPTDQYGLINGDWNSVLQPGGYRIFGGNTNTNSPPNAYLYGTLVVFGGGGQISSRTQVYYEHVGGRAYWRSAWNGNDWQGWFTAAGTGDVDYLRQTVTSNTNRIGAVENTRTVNQSNAARIASGTATATNFTSTGYGGTSAYSGYVDVTWPAMTLVSVVATAQSGDTGGCTAQITNQSNSGCRIVLVRRNQANTGVNWVAVGN